MVKIEAIIKWEKMEEVQKAFPGYQYPGNDGYRGKGVWTPERSYADIQGSEPG